MQNQNLNVKSVCPLWLVSPVCPVCPDCPGCPVCPNDPESHVDHKYPDNHDDHDNHDHEDPDDLDVQGDHDDYLDHLDHLDHDDNCICKEVGGCSQGSWRLADLVEPPTGLCKEVGGYDAHKCCVDCYELIIMNEWWRWLFSLGLQIKGSSSFWYLLTHGERFQPTRALIKHWTQLASNTNDCNSESESRKWKLDYPLLLRHLWTPPCWAKAPRLANLPTCLVALTFRAETPPIDDDCWLLFVCWTPPPWLPLLDAPWDDD